MADLRSTQAAQQVVNGTSVVTVYTVPTGKRFILKSINVMEISGSGSDVQLRVGTIGTILRGHVNAYGSGGDSFDASFWLVLNAGQTIDFKRVSSGQINVQVSGSLHTV